MSDRTSLSFNQWHAKPFVQPIMTSEKLGWDGISLYTSHLETRMENQISPLTEDCFLIFVLEGAARTQGKANGKVVEDYFTTGSIQLHPAWTESEARWDTPVTVAFIQLPPSLITQLADSSFRGDPAHVQIPPNFNFRDPLLNNLLNELCYEVQNPSPVSAIFAQSAGQTIMLHLLRKYSNVTVRRLPQRAKLTDHQMCVIDEYIESNLDRKISLTELATLLFMSQSHFERLFRLSVGCPPHRYVLSRKVERAKWLLLHTSLPLQQIAEQCGFATQSHFTRHFTQQVGISPARFRNQR